METFVIESSIPKYHVIDLSCGHHSLYLQVADEEAVGELTAPVASVVLTLVCNLRHCFLTDQAEVAQMQDISHYITLLDAAGTTQRPRIDGKRERFSLTIFCVN